METGQTNYGHVDITTGVDSHRKTTNVEPTWWISSFVREPRRIAHMAHIYFNGSLGGTGVKFFTNESLHALRENHWVVTESETDSLIAVMVPYGKAHINKEVIDMRGSFVEFQASNADHYPWQYEHEKRGFNEINSPFMIARPDLWRGSNGRANSLLWMGQQYAVTTTPMVYNDRTMNKGHLGPQYAGVDTIYRGVGGQMNEALVPMVL